jgi:nifR3 family TIM-barrel protein
VTNFWQNLNKPFLAFAPMDDVTDVVFREIITNCAKPDVFFTEFTSSDALVSEGYQKAVLKLKYTENQHYIVAQIWGNDPEKIYKAAKIVRDLNFDGIDINMGCPIRKIIKRGSGAGLIGNYKLVSEIISAAKKGAGNIPLSIKTRIGNKSIITEEWITFLLKEGIDTLTIHGRIAARMSKGACIWSEIEKAVHIKNKISSNTIIIGNGSVESYSQALEIYKNIAVDGLMIGRGVFANPWVFEKKLNPVKHSKDEYLALLIKHMDLFEKTWGKGKNFDVLKKYFKIYVNNFYGSKTLRIKLMAAKNTEEAKSILLN